VEKYKFTEVEEDNKNRTMCVVRHVVKWEFFTLRLTIDGLYHNYPNKSIVLRIANSRCTSYINVLKHTIYDINQLAILF